MAVEDQEVFGSHGQAEYGFEHDEPGDPGVEFFEPWKRPEEFRISNGFNNAWLARHCDFPNYFFGHKLLL